jgi:hypothetical protein
MFKVDVYDDDGLCWQTCSFDKQSEAIWFAERKCAQGFDVYEYVG